METRIVETLTEKDEEQPKNVICCQLCLNPYSGSKTATPRILQCGHTTCHSCLQKIIKNSVIKCPFCRDVTRVMGNSVETLKKNFALLDVNAESEVQPGEASMNNIIEEEHFLVNELLLYAREGHWEGVWQILGKPQQPKKVYLINIIPEERRWAILHQALFWKDEKVLKTLLEFPSCDPRIITKQYTTDAGEKTHDNAVEVAKKQGFDRATAILESHTLATQEQDTFLPENADIDKQGTSIISITLAAYKNTFHPAKVDPQHKVTDILRVIYNTMNTTDSWKKIRDIIYDYAFVIDRGEAVGKSTTRDKFYRAFVQVYTDEDTWFYDTINTALRKQKTTNYRPSGNDLAIGPFVTTFQMILLYWDKLPRESGQTYRQVLLSENDLKKYKEGVRFSWHSFVSSAKEYNNAMNFPTVEASGDCNVMFIIDNSKESFRRPRDVSAYSYKQETERLYPIGARFKVTKVTQKDIGTDINIELL